MEACVYEDWYMDGLSSVICNSPKLETTQTDQKIKNKKVLYDSIYIKF